MPRFLKPLGNREGEIGCNDPLARRPAIEEVIVDLSDGIFQWGGFFPYTVTVIENTVTEK